MSVPEEVLRQKKNRFYSKPLGYVSTNVADADIVTRYLAPNCTWILHYHLHKYYSEMLS